MPNTAQVKFQELDQSFGVASILNGIVAVSVQTLRGPYGHDGNIYRSWAEFSRVYGGEVSGMTGPTIVKRALERGAVLRINKVGHYVDIDDVTSLDAVKATPDESGASFAVDGTDHLFDFTAKNHGADYNNLTVQIKDASNGDADYFDIEISHDSDGRLLEVYRNLTIDGVPTVAQSDYLKEVQEKSQLVTVTYQDLSALSAGLRPTNGTWGFQGGSNGGSIVDADYVGSTAGGTGFYAFDNYDDFEFITSMDKYTDTVHAGGAAYVAAREDCFYICHLPLSNDTVAELQSARSTLAIDSRYVVFITGGLKVPNPFLDGQILSVPELGDMLGAAARSAVEYGPWYSFAGQQRGLVYNALGVVNNFATGGTTKLNSLANRQINVVAQRDGRILFMGNFTGQMISSRKSFLNVMRLIVYIKKSLRPLLEYYLEEPNDFATWKRIHNDVVPFFDNLVDKRALVRYSWNGDQYANKDADLKVNTRADIDQGKYAVELYMVETVSLQELTIKIISANGSVSFEDNIN